MRKGDGRPLTEALLKSKSKVDEATGCWNFIGDKSQKYPRVNFSGIMLRASHAALLLKLERLPEPGMNAMHSCDNPRCVNPSHISEGTSKDNRADSVAKGRFRGWKLSDETKAKMSKAKRGRKLSEAAKQKISDYWRHRREAA